MSYFSGIEKIGYEGEGSKNPFAFKHYDKSQVVLGKTMEEHLRFAVAYWHTFTADGTDPFGQGTMVRPWDKWSYLDLAKKRVEASFEFYEKLDVPFFCFHDRDIAPEGENLKETNENLDVIVSMIKDYMKTSKVKLLWNTANMFTNPRFVHGAATTSNAEVFAYAAAQVKKGLEVGKELGSDNYVFWGGREGYESLLNTDYKLEQDNIARFYHMALAYADEIGYTGQFLIEPKPKEPSKHQYDFDAATTISFLKTYDLDKRFKLNLEANHATLAGHTFEHELRVARSADMLGSIDANQGDLLLGWDTDEFPTDLYATTLALYEIVENGGLGKGGVNFDAKVRRTSFQTDDLFLAHIAGMDAFAKSLKVVEKLKEDRFFESILEERYETFSNGIGKEIVDGKADFHALEKYALTQAPIQNKSGRIELIKARLNEYLFSK
ncbi:xylose isomerase [Alkalihalobacillus trypoxylicola]|uniref:Xylose isomerase n=1 Tax=Alkalihalobacillus trypoxylicola TaxID=519424 RepID=A0A162F307_9BACI|nr:xylose isomerase [Alkalihalobacillus trypoxylicola]KYG34376.1 xylose isomerase [Alkalihalobacillus trypoxylicola]